jgi:hypothetical protein
VSPRKFFIAVDYDNLTTEFGTAFRPEPAISNYVQQFGEPARRVIYAALLPTWFPKKKRLTWLKRHGWDVYHRAPASRAKAPDDTHPERALRSLVDTKLVMDVWEAAVRGVITDVLLVSGDVDFAPLLEGLRTYGVGAYLIGPHKSTHPELILAADCYATAGNVAGLVYTTPALSPLVESDSIDDLPTDDEGVDHTRTLLSDDDSGATTPSHEVMP